MSSTRKTAKYRKAVHHLKWDLAIIIVSIAIAVIFAHMGVFAHLFTLAQSFQLVGAFIAGIFFTSMFTVAAASIAFVEIGNSTNMWTISFVGALGAVFGDMLLFLFIRDNLATDLKEILNTSSYRKFIGYFHGGTLRWLSPILGAFVIASPLPDELGLTLMGMSKMRSIYMIPITFVMNFFGILAILAITNHL
jgi:hypothetical protein